MKVSDVMSRDVAAANPTESIRNVAKIMAKIDAGVLPVGENDRPVGMIDLSDLRARWPTLAERELRPRGDGVRGQMLRPNAAEAPKRASCRPRFPGAFA